MTFAESFKTVLFKKYCNFKGRASRSEYWYFYLAYLIIGMVAAFISGVVGDKNNILPGVWSLLALLPLLGVTWRRLHDSGKSGAWIFVSLIPLVGWIWAIVLLCKPSMQAPNRFGEIPED